MLLKHDKHDGDDVTQVNGGKFSDFINEYENSRNKHTNPLSVELKSIIEIKNHTWQQK